MCVCENPHNKCENLHNKSEKFPLKKNKTKTFKNQLFHHLFYLYNNTIIINIYYKIN